MDDLKPGDGCKEGRKLGSRSVVLGNHAVVDNVVEDVEVGSGVVVVVDLKNSILLIRFSKLFQWEEKNLRWIV